MRYSIYFLAIICLGISSCASGPPLTEDELEYNRQQSRENWALCERIMEAQHVQEAIHNHHHDRHRAPRLWMIKQDLANNFCRARLGELWADSIKRGE